MKDDREECCNCGDVNTFYSFNGFYPLCKKCYLLWGESPESKESKRTKTDFFAFFEKWLNRDKREKVQFT